MTAESTQAALSPVRHLGPPTINLKMWIGGLGVISAPALYEGVNVGIGLAISGLAALVATVVWDFRVQNQLSNLETSTLVSAFASLSLVAQAFVVKQIMLGDNLALYLLSLSMAVVFMYTGRPQRR